MRKRRLPFVLSACMVLSVGLQSGYVFAEQPQSTGNGQTVYEYLNDFDIDEFKKSISENEKRLMTYPDYDQAKSFVESEILIIDDLSSAYSIEQNKYLNDNSDMDSFYKMNKTASYLYEAQKSLDDFIVKLAATDTYVQLKQDFILPPVYDQEFIESQTLLINQYYESADDAEKLAQIYIDLVSCRKLQAMHQDFNDYAGMVFSQVYGREFSPSNVENISSALSSFISMYSEYNFGTEEIYKCATGLTKEETLAEFESLLSVLPENIKSVYNTAQKNAQFTLSDNENGSQAAVTSYLYKYHNPCSYIKYSQTNADFSNLMNQFGYFTALSFKEQNNSYYGSSHTSEYMLLTIRDFIKILCYQNNCTNALSEILEELRNAYVINELETYAYSQPDLTVEKLSRKYYEINKSLGVRYSEDQTDDISWVYSENLYTAPFSMADNIASSLKALEYYDVIRTSQSESAAKILDSFITSPDTATVEELSEINNIPSCFDSENITTLSQRFGSYLNDIYDPADITLPGDVNNDGSVTVSDICIVKRYILNLIDDDQMTQKGYLAENADLNYDGKTDVSDLLALSKIILE